MSVSIHVTQSHARAFSKWSSLSLWWLRGFVLHVRHTWNAYSSRAHHGPFTWSCSSPLPDGCSSCPCIFSLRPATIVAANESHGRLMSCISMREFLSKPPELDDSFAFIAQWLCGSSRRQWLNHFTCGAGITDHTRAIQINPARAWVCTMRFDIADWVYKPGMNGYGSYGGVNSNGYTYTSGWDPKMYCRQRPVGQYWHLMRVTRV